MRRYRNKVNFQPFADQSGLSWEYVASQTMLESSMSWCDANDIDMYDAKTGELWDYEPVWLT